MNLHPLIVFAFNTGRLLRRFACILQRHQLCWCKALPIPWPHAQLAHATILAPQIPAVADVRLSLMHTQYLAMPTVYPSCIPGAGKLVKLSISCISIGQARQHSRHHAYFGVSDRHISCTSYKNMHAYIHLAIFFLIILTQFQCQFF